jgi:hypothetical protein
MKPNDYYIPFVRVFGHLDDTNHQEKSINMTLKWCCNFCSSEYPINCQTWSMFDYPLTVISHFERAHPNKLTVELEKWKNQIDEDVLPFMKALDGIPLPTAKWHIEHPCPEQFEIDGRNKSETVNSLKIRKLITDHDESVNWLKSTFDKGMIDNVIIDPSVFSNVLKCRNDRLQLINLWDLVSKKIDLINLFAKLGRGKPIII